MEGLTLRAGISGANINEYGAEEELPTDVIAVTISVCGPGVNPENAAVNPFIVVEFEYVIAVADAEVGNIDALDVLV